MSITINDYYDDKCVFITGATGFVGKLLIEKLLYSCTSLRTIYCLIREKTNGQTINERLNEITSCKVFDKLRKREPNFRERLVPVNGNITFNDLNMTTAIIEEIQKNVSVVFHLAGTANFEENLRTSLLLNVLGLRKVIEFSKQLPNLDAFVHISSLYANINRSYIEEKIYETTVPPQRILNLLEWMEDDWLELASKKLIGDKPNTFTYTKWLAETLLQNEADKLPVIIIRPSNIGASWKEPFAGWVEKSSGPCDLFIAAGRGYLRSMKGEGHAVLDIIPVDIVVNLIISSAWSKAVNKRTTEQVITDSSIILSSDTIKATDQTEQINNIDVYNCSTGGLHPFRWGEMGKFDLKN
jgi:alcohol-forming fatty acyl-CoA reductase